MHSRLVKSIASVMGAAALVAAPVALLAPAAQAAPIVSAIIVPDETYPHDPKAGTNDPGFWEEWIAEETDGVVAWCTKDDSISKPYTIPAIEDEFELEEGEDYDDYAYILAVLKGGANQEDNAANELYWNPNPGDQLSHSTAGNSHVILCIAELEDEPTEPTEPTKPTGPVVETDRVSDTQSSPATLGLLAGGALIAGAGALFLSRRRQGDHR